MIRNDLKDYLKRRFQWCKAYSLAKKIKNHHEDHKVVSLRPTGPCCGNVLLSYLLKPFVLKSGQSVSHFHSNYSEALLIAQTFLELGYSVDVINWWNQKFGSSRN